MSSLVADLKLNPTITINYHNDKSTKLRVKHDNAYKRTNNNVKAKNDIIIINLNIRIKMLNKRMLQLIG